jgi:hypothetical protein
MTLRKQVITTMVLGVLFFIISSISFNNAHSYSTGAPGAKTGSPGDGATCTNCHSGTASPQTNWITSNVPASGYVPGTTYTFTATATFTGCTKFGFEISPQNASGTLLGTLIATNTTETQLIASSKYITHTSGGTSVVTTGTKSWSFDWTAPIAGTGAVTFYGAFNATNSSGTNSGDNIYNSNLIVAECAVPIAPATITGTAAVCINSPFTYTAATSVGATSYTWTLPIGWTGASTTNSINATTGAAGGVISVKANNACGASSLTSLATTVNIMSTTPSQTNVACNGANTGTAKVTVTGGTSPYTYTWNTTPVQTNSIATNLTAGAYSVDVTDASGCIKTQTFTITEPTIVSVSASTTNVLCNGGSTGTATAVSTGGVSPYTYSWNTSPVQTTATATNLMQGSYTVTVTDANLCTASKLVVINEPTVLASTINQTNVLCKGGASGTATALPTGGLAPYTYSWNTSPVQNSATATGLVIGNYTVIVKDANNCATSKSTTITQPATLVTVTDSVTAKVLCNGNANGAALLKATGGTTPYTYSWNTSPVQTTSAATNLAAGTYKGIVTDANGCKDSSILTLTQPTVLLPNIIATNVLCHGGATGTASAENPGGTPPYTYSWNTAPVQTTTYAQNLPAGTYILTITDSNNCVSTVSTTVSEPTVLATTIMNFSAVCKGDSSGSAMSMPTGGVSPYSYSWNTIPVQTTATATHLAAGVYTVVTSDANGCNKTDMVTIVEPSTKVSVTASSTNSLCATPTGTLSAMATGGTGTLTYSWNTSPVQTTANVSNVASGIYMVTATDANGCTAKVSTTVSNPSGAVATITATTNVLCYGYSTGAATVAITGGTGPYTYSWNTLVPKTTASVSNLPAGNFTATVTDANGCTATAIATITQTAPVSGSVTKTNVTCYGGNNGSATIAGTGGTGPYTYSWNTLPVKTTATITNLISNVYTCTVTDANGCFGTKQASITQSTAINVSKSQNNPTCGTCVDGNANVIVSGGSAPYTYSWNTSPVQTTASLLSVGIGKYIVTITDANGCTKKDSVALSLITGLTSTTSTENNYTLYPNPATDKLNVAIDLNYASAINIVITNVLGQYIANQTFTNSVNTTFDLTNIKAGVYFITMETNKEKVTKRFVKQ